MSNEIRSDRIARYLAKIAPDAEVDTLDEMAQRIAMGQSLVKVCESWDVPYMKFYAWLTADPGRFSVLMNALAAKGFVEADEIKDIADESGDAKLMVDARKFRVPKLSPVVWGDSREKGGGGITVVVNRGLGNPSVVSGSAANQPMCDAVSECVSDSVLIECDGRNLTIN